MPEQTVPPVGVVQAFGIESDLNKLADAVHASTFQGQRIGEVVDREAPAPIPTPEELMQKLNDAPLIPEEPEYELDELKKIMDQMLHAGFATHSFKIGDVSVTLRSRYDWEERAMYKRLEESGIQLQNTFLDEQARLVLAASLLQIGPDFYETKKLPLTERDAHFETRYARVLEMPILVRGMLGKELQSFDRKLVYIQMNSNKLIENFS